MKTHLTGLLVVALGVCASLASAQTDKQAEKVLKAALADAAKAHVKALKAIIVPGTGILQEANAAASSGASAPGDSVDVVAGEVSLLELALTNATNAAVMDDACIAVDTALENAGLPLPLGALVGTGGTFDRRLAAMDRHYQASLARSRKASRVVLHTLTKQGEPAALRAPDTTRPAFAPGFSQDGTASDGPAAAFVPPPLQFTALVGYSASDQPGDGALQISGSSQLTDDVKLTGRGPEGSSFGPVVVTPQADGSFEATITDLPEGNWRVQAVQPVAIATDYVGIPGAPDPGTDPVSPKQAAKDAKTAWRQLVKLHAGALNQQLKIYKSQLKAARKSLKGGADPDAVLDGVYAALDQFDQIAEDATNGADGAQGMANAVFSQKLDGLDQLVDEQLVGFGTSNDKASAQIERHLEKRAAAALSATRGFARFLAKRTDRRLAVDLQPPPFRLAAPVKGPPLPLPATPLRLEVLTGTSRTGVSDDGVLRLRLSGDGALGARIDVVLFGPDGFTLVDTLSAENIVGGLTVRYPASGPGDLPEGNYLAVLRQGSVVVSGAISVPGGN